MWFKNIQLFRFLTEINFSAEEFSAALESKQAKPCPKTEKFTQGWVSPFGKDSEVLVHTCQGFWLFAYCKEERVLPAAVVREELQQVISGIEQREGRRIRAKEKVALREEVTFELLPRAFTKQKIICGYIDTQAGLLVLDTPSRAQAEEITVLMRTCLGSLQIGPVTTNSSPMPIMTDWLKNNNCPDPFYFEESCELIDPREARNTVRCQHQDLGAPEIQAHLESGKQVVSLAMNWQETFAFAIQQDLIIKRLRCLDVLQERRQEYHAATTAERLDADFALMSGELSRYFEALFALFGGLEPVEQVARPQLAEVV